MIDHSGQSQSGGEAGGTTLEWALLLAGVALPSFFIMKLAMEALIGYYQMMTTVNALPFP